MSGEGWAPRPGRCEVCGQRSLFAAESRCFRHPIAADRGGRPAGQADDGQAPAPPGEA